MIGVFLPPPCSIPPPSSHLVPELDAVELVGRLEQLRPEGGGDELGVASQLHDHVWTNQENERTERGPV